MPSCSGLCEEDYFYPVSVFELDLTWTGTSLDLDLVSTSLGLDLGLTALCHSDVIKLSLLGNYKFTTENMN